MLFLGFSPPSFTLASEADALESEVAAERLEAADDVGPTGASCFGGGSFPRSAKAAAPPAATIAAATNAFLFVTIPGICIWYQRAGASLIGTHREACNLSIR